MQRLKFKQAAANHGISRARREDGNRFFGMLWRSRTARVWLGKCTMRVEKLHHSVMLKLSA